MSDDNHQETPALKGNGSLADPFETWPNGDLLLDQHDRDFLRENYAMLAPIFDWPELRASFEQYDKNAADARRRSQQFGVRAVATGFASLLLGALTSLIGVATPSMVVLTAGLGFLAAVLAVSSMIMGWTQILRGKEKAEWLADRFYAEMIRQFHFQLIANHLARVVEAVKDPSELQSWLGYRQDQFQRFSHTHLRSGGEMFHHLLMDHAESGSWITREWAEPESAPHRSPELYQLLTVLGKQRFGIQRRYATLKLAEGWHSPNTRARWTARTTDNLTLLLLIATLVAGLCAAATIAGGGAVLVHAGAIAVAALCGAGVIALRVLNEGFQFSADADRCTWYLAAVASLESQFTHASISRKVDLLRQMEHLAYQEMRRFIVSSERSRFVM